MAHISCCKRVKKWGWRRVKYERFMISWSLRARRMRAKVERQLVEISKKKAGNGAMGEKTGVKIETDDQIEGSRLDAQPLPPLPKLLRPRPLEDRGGRSLFERAGKYDYGSDQEELVFDLPAYNQKRLDQYHKAKEARRVAGYASESSEDEAAQ